LIDHLPAWLALAYTSDTLEHVVVSTLIGSWALSLMSKKFDRTQLGRALACIGTSVFYFRKTAFLHDGLDPSADLALRIVYVAAMGIIATLAFVLFLDLVKMQRLGRRNEHDGAEQASEAT